MYPSCTFIKQSGSMKLINVFQIWRNALLSLNLVVFLPLLVLVINTNFVTASEKVSLLDPDPNPNLEYEADDRKEFEDFCHFQSLSRNTPEEFNLDDCKKIDEREFHDHDLHILFMVFAVILYGALVRSILKYLQLTLPYTVVIMASGMCVGLASKYHCYEMYTYTAFARLNAKIYLFTFLPVLLFESSFAMSGHMFVKASGQVLLLAAPGMLFCTFMTGFVCYTFFPAYGWPLLNCIFFGCIISATDPVAVVAILKECGVSETLSILIDGESLLNDGVAILLYEVLGGLLKDESENHHSIGAMVEHVFRDFMRIAVGGPLFGWFMAKLAISALSRVFNDAVVEITITLVAAYMTYYIGEAVLRVSGVMAVVLLGLTMSSEKTCISPDTEKEVHEFWEMLGHLANTVLFFITGVIITERGTRGMAVDDLYYLILLFCALNLIRFFMLLILSPILTRIGYGMTWQNMIVMMWGGLRGAVGICLSLQVYEEKQFCTNQFGSKILIQTAGIVFMTLIINGTTSKKLLQLLKLTEISQGRMEEMKNAVKAIHVTQKRALLMLRHDRFLADANWTFVAENTKIEDPYRNKQVKSGKKNNQSSILSLGPEHIMNECPECHTFVANQPTNEELRNMTEEARLRIIKAMKISYWAHFERGVLTEEAVQTLAGVADTCSDRPMYMIHAKDLKKYWQIRGIFPWIREKLVKQLGEGDPRDSLRQTPKPAEKWRVYCWYIVTKKWFEYLMTAVVLIHVLPAVSQLFVESHYSQCGEVGWMQDYETAFTYINFVFTGIYTLEIVTKLIGFGMSNYWSSRWNWLDAFATVLSWVNLVLSLMSMCGKNGVAMRNISKIIKIARCCRFLKLIRPLFPMAMNFVNGKINTQLFLGYDVALGFIVGCDDVLKFLPQMIDNKKVFTKIRNSIERERMDAVREMGVLQKDHPGIAIAIKTRHASRSVLNQMKGMLVELRTDGLLDEKENDLLTIVLEERMKHLWSLPNYITPPSPEALLENLIWLYGHSELRDFIFENATLLQYEVSDVIVGIGDPPHGIYVIISGMVKLRYEPDMEIKVLRETYGAIPAMEVFKDFDFDKQTEDFFSSGTVIGESACLTGRHRAASVICETEGVTAYHISLTAMRKALMSFTDKYNSLEERLWRASGLRRCSQYLATQPGYQNLAKEKLDALLERSCCPIGAEFEVIRIPNYVHDVVVIEGWVEDTQTGELYIAPCVIPKTCSVFKMKENPKTLNRVLVILAEDRGPDEDDQDELAQCLRASKKLRRPSIPPDQTIALARQANLLEEKGQLNSAPPREKDRQKRPSMSVNFGTVRRKSKKSIDEGKTNTRNST